jgi:hypothetical protein
LNDLKEKVENGSNIEDEKDAVNSDKRVVDIRKTDFQQCEITLGNRLLNPLKIRLMMGRVEINCLAKED